MKVCAFTDEISKDFDEALRLAKAAGADCVEIRGGLYGGDVTSVDAERLVRIQNALAHHGLRVACIGSPFGKCHHDRPEDVQKHYQFFERAMALGKALDCRLIRCFSFWNPRGGDPALRAKLPEHLPTVVSLLRPIVQAAEAAGFVFGLENEEDTMVGTAEEVVLLQKALDDSPAFGVVWDILNELAAGEDPFPYGYGLIRDRIVHVHIKPNRYGNMVSVGDTKLTYGEILVALHHAGFHGAASIEHWGSSDAMLAGINQLRSAVDALGPAISA